MTGFLSKKGGRAVPAPGLLVVLLVGRLADDAAVERDAVELDREAAVLVGPGDADPVPVALAVAAPADVPGDVGRGFSGRFGFGVGVGHDRSPSRRFPAPPLGPYGTSRN